MRRRAAVFGLAAAAMAGLGGGIGWWWSRRGTRLPAARPPASGADFAAAHRPLPPPEAPLQVYHLGHSLVGRNMPKILAQFAGHRFHSQLGWGTSLRQHWLGGAEINGHATENAHEDFRPARQALSSGDYDAVVFTEMVELRDALRWHASPHYLAQWAKLAQAANPEVRLYLYETWHRLDSPEGWQARLDADLPALWQGELLRGALAWGAPALSLIPAGQVLAATARAAAQGALPGLESHEALFAPLPDGGRDQIHLGPTGAYLVALTHYAVLYQRSPEGLPHRVALVDGPEPVLELAPDLAQALQRLVWQVVRATPHTGIAA